MNRTHWLMVASVGAMLSLSGCSSVSQKWQQWRGQDAPASAQAAAPRTLKATDETGRWSGLYSYQAQMGRFQECETGQIIAVRMEGDNALLENAYMAARMGESQPMLATVEGRIVAQPDTDPIRAKQGITQLALRVERFVSLSSGTSCAAGKAVALGAHQPMPPVSPAQSSATATASAKSGTALVGSAAPGASEAAKASAPALPPASKSHAPALKETYWKLVQLQGQPVPALEREPHIILQEPSKLVGSSGCNRLLGDWQQQGSHLHFAKVATTRMACKASAARVEKGLLAALKGTAQWHMEGQRLHLKDSKGHVQAVLQAVPR